MKGFVGSVMQVDPGGQGCVSGRLRADAIAFVSSVRRARISMAWPARGVPRPEIISLGCGIAQIADQA